MALNVPEFKVDSDNNYIQEHVDLIRSAIAGKPVKPAAVERPFAAWLAEAVNDQGFEHLDPGSSFA